MKELLTGDTLRAGGASTDSERQDDQLHMGGKGGGDTMPYKCVPVSCTGCHFITALIHPENIETP